MNIQDITYQFRAAARLVAPGTLVEDDHFSLFEAVGALEIGDPKMDSGALEPGETLDEEFDMEKEFLPEELIWLMDEMLNREVAWLMGYPLSQTLFTSVHVDRLLWPDPKSLEESTFIRGRSPDELSLPHKVLRAYCLLLIKICDCVLGMVTSQHYYEEEDFTTQLFNRELLHRFSEESILEVAGEAIEALARSDLGLDKRTAISVRLKFRNDILETLIQHADGRNPPASLFPLMHDSLNEAQKTHRLGIVVPKAFSTKLQRRLASTVPPRPMVTVSMNEAWAFWHQTLTDCKNVFSIHQAAHPQDLITAYQIFAYSSPQPSTYPRALLQSFLSSDGMVASRIGTICFLEEDLRSLTLSASQLLMISDGAYGRLHNGSQKVADCMQRFIDQFQQTFVNVYRALCLNSCRIRRTFCHALTEWDVLQGHVEEMDCIIQEALHEKPTQYLPGSPPTFSFSLSSWVYHHKLNILKLTIQMGFDQMIYAPHEMGAMYWYLSTICDIHLSHLERVSHFVSAKDTEVKRGSMNAASKAKATEECKVALDRLYRQYAWAKATQLLASTLHGIFIVLQQLGIFVRQGPLYSSDALRYEIRMKPFLSLSIPEALAPEDFASRTDLPNLTIEELLTQAMTTGASAKRAWEEVAKTTWNIYPKEDGGASVIDEKWNADVKDCLKAAIAANLCVLTLKKVVNNEEWKVKAAKEARLPGPNEKGRWHRWWVVPHLPAA